MDPDETLAAILRLASDVYADDAEWETAYELASAVVALDNWLARGGFLPNDWRNAR